jgi:energy-coupling factor transport system substrate-specific component
VVRPSVVRLGARTTTALVLVSVAGLAMFLWPLLIVPPEGAAPGVGAPAVFVLIMPAILAILLAEMSSGELDTKAVAMLGVLTAIGAALRPLGAGVAGIETIFFLLVLAGRVYGPGFGFVLGTTTMFASAILTGGLGPWLPFQMLASGWVGLGAGLLPRRVTGRAELAMLAAYGAVSAFAFGFVLNMWFWPYTIGADTQLSYVAGGPVVENLQRFFLYTVATSTLGWDMGRAITNVVAILVLGPTILAVLHRASRRAAFDASSAFDHSPAGASAYHQRP